MNTGIPLILNFDLKAPLSLDQRLSVNTTSELNSIPNPYSGMPVYSADTQTIYYLKNIINGQKTWIPVPEADKFVVITGNQSISGVKNFDTYPMVNVEGQMKRVITQGDQSLGALSGIPNFPENAVYNNNILLNSSSSGYLTGDGYSGNYDGGYFFGRTKITQNTNRIIDSSIGNNFRAITGTSIENALPLTGSWRWLACNSDAKYITASNDSNYLSVSNDYGKTWYQTATGFGPRNWKGLSMSTDGKYQIALASFQTYTGLVANSENYGITWSANTTILSADSTSWVAPAISSDGKYQTVIYTDQSASLPNNPISVHVSEDYGKNFSAFTLPHDPNLVNTRFIAMSSDGKYQTIAVTKSIVTSANYGKNWTVRTVPNQGVAVPFFSVSMTADGRFQIVITSGNNANDGEVYISNNYGVTWKLVKTFGRNINLTSVSNSDHGRLITVSTKDGFIYTSYDYGNNWTLRTTAQSVSTTLTAAITTTTATSISVDSVAGIGTNNIIGNRFLLIDNEVIYMQNGSTIVGNVLTNVLRNYAGTTASTHANGVKVTLSSDWRRNVMSNDGKYQIICDANFSETSNNRYGYIYISVADEKIDGTIYADKFNSTNMQAETGIFNKVSGSFILFNSTTAPSSPAKGQLFFDTINNNFSGYNGTSWLKLNN